MLDVGQQLWRARAVGRQTWRQLTNLFDPSPGVADSYLREVPIPDTALICIYRRRNAAFVRRLLAAQSPAAADVRLWALDEVVPELATLTIGAGPGDRTVLLNRLHREVADSAAHLLIADDDVVISRRRLLRLIRAAVKADLDIAQPAHTPWSHHSWPFTERHAGCLWRCTDFVEQGPLVLLSPTARALCFPLDESLGMGWGIEVEWWALQREGLRLGIVDSAPAAHKARIAVDYDGNEQNRQRLAICAQHGVGGYAALMNTHWQVSARSRLVHK